MFFKVYVNVFSFSFFRFIRIIIWIEFVYKKNILSIYRYLWERFFKFIRI